jgi:hypothetical protein
MCRAFFCVRADDAISGSGVGQHGPGGVVGAKVLRTCNVQKVDQAAARAIDAALDGADRAAADFRGFLIREPGRSNQD